MRQETIAGLTVRLTGGSDGDGGGDGPMVVLMHGFGAPGTDLIPLASELDVPQAVRFVFPEAPQLLPPELGGGAGRCWWMIDVMRLQMAIMMGQTRDLSEEVPEGLADANQGIARLLDALETDHGMRRDQLVLGGFSQGAMLACDVALRTDTPLAGLVLMSGTYLARGEWQPRMESREGLAVLQSHGRDDPLLPFSMAEKLRDALLTAGLPVTWVPFDGGHGIAPSVLAALSDFIQVNL